MISTRYMNESETKKVKKAYKTTRKQENTATRKHSIQDNTITKQAINKSIKPI
jgi:hypothetical protein